jgi:predicted O-methyltransferase YrrM
MQSELVCDYIACFLDKYKSLDIEDLYAYALNSKVPAVDKNSGELLRFLAHLKGTKHILELGCGIGIATKYMKYTDSVKITALDYNKDRLDEAADYLKDEKNIDFVHAKAEDYLSNTSYKFDFVFVDTIKREYAGMWYLLKRCLSDKALVVFDDILLYGYVLYEDAEIPYKYLETVRELKAFIDEIKYTFSSDASIIPLGNGLLLINYEKY